MDLADKLFLMMGDKSSTHENTKAWLSFVTKNYPKWNIEEIELAFSKAITGDLMNSKNEPMELYQKLDIIQTGRILKAYRAYILRNTAHQINKQRLKKEKEMKVKPNKELDLEALKLVFNEVRDFDYSDKGHIVYNDLNDLKVLRYWSNETKKRFLSYVEKKIIQHKKNELLSKRTANSKSILKYFTETITQGNSKIGVFKCQNIFVSNYLRGFKDFEDLRRELAEIKIKK